MSANYGREASVSTRPGPWLAPVTRATFAVRLSSLTFLRFGADNRPMITQPIFAYVGCYTSPERNGRGNGINVYRVDPRNGALRHVQHLGGLENPSFLAMNVAGTASIRYMAIAAKRPPTLSIGKPVVSPS
jgi:hypothetical protein